MLPSSFFVFGNGRLGMYVFNGDVVEQLAVCVLLSRGPSLFGGLRMVESYT